MKKIERQVQMIQEKIQRITEDKSKVIAHFSIHDHTVQAEMRLDVHWTITAPVDSINYPRDLDPERPNYRLWNQMVEITQKIEKTARFVDRRIPEGYESQIIKINERTKEGPARRAEAKASLIMEWGRQFLVEYKMTIGKRHLAEIRKQITDFQSQQKTLIPQLRESNSKYIAARKIKNQEQTIENSEALKLGRFWEVDRDALKDYFHPPFSRNYLSDISEKWRAALYTEMASTAWKAGKGDWRHKNVGTGRGYLCGVDDNGDEWGHLVNLEEWMDRDYYGDLDYKATVENAMCKLFDIAASELTECQRQGDLLFCALPPSDLCRFCGQPKILHHDRPCANNANITITLSCGTHTSAVYTPNRETPKYVPSDVWEPRESHRITSPGLMRNGRFFKSDSEIIITHTSHPKIILLPGEYRLYMLRIADAD